MAGFDPDAYLADKEPKAAPPAPASGFDPDQYLASKQPAGFDPDAYIAKSTNDRVQQLIADPKFDPSSYAIQTGDKETAFQAREALRNRSLGDKVAAAGQALTEPATYGNAAMGALKFGAGAIAAPLHGLAQGAATFAAPLAGAVGADNLQRTLENEQQTQGAESTLAGQRVEEGLRATGRAVKNFAQDHPALATIANPIAGVLPQQPAATEQDQRARFDDEIQAAKNAQQLQQQQPLNTGAVAAAAKLATNQENLQDVYSPNALAAQGARPVSPFLTESMAAAGDPTNLAIPLAGEIPGVKNIAGGLVQAGGKLLQVPESIMGLVPKVAKLAKIGEGTATASTLGAVGYSALNHPAALAAAGGTYGLGKLLGFTGRALEEQGGALRSGIPSALDQSAQSALSAGQSAIGTNIQRGIGNAANNIVSTALGFAPVNAVLADGDPRKFAESEVGSGAMGGVFGLAGEQARMENIANYRLAKYGAQQFNENPMWQAHQDTMSKFSPQDQQAINALRGTLYGGTGTDVLVLDGQNFAKQVGDIGGNARGQFAAGPDGTIYLNADAIGKTPSQKAASTLDAAGHETGHAVVDFLKNAGREGDAQNLFQSISSALTPEQVQAMTDSYHGKLLASTDLTGKSPEEVNAIKQKIASDNPPEKITEENLAEVTRRLLTGKNISSYSLPKPITESIMDAASRFMEARGWMPAVDPNASLNFKAQMVREAARRMNDVLYETGKTASAKANEGPTATQQLIDAKNRLSALPEITSDMPIAKARAIARQRDQAQKDLNEVQGMLNPEAEQPAPQAAAPEASPKLNRFRIAAILRQQGLSQSEAKQWADAANGNTDEEAVVDALKQRASQKFPSAPAQPVPQPASKPQPVEQPIPTHEERPVSTSKEKQSVAAVNASDVSGSGASTQTATSPADQVAPDVSDRTTAPVKTKEEVEQIVNDAEKTATSAEKNTKTKAAQDRIRKAKIEAVLSTIDPQEGGLHKETDQFGNETIVGDYDPTDPRHEALGKIAGLSKDAAQKLQETQDAKGKPLYIRYRSALSGQENEGETETGMVNRKAEYRADPANKRTEGTVQHKVIIPVGTEMTNGGKIVSKFITLDNLFHNVSSIFEGLKGIGKDNPYGDTREAQGPLLTSDAQAYAENHANGYKGDGSGPIKQFPDSGLPKTNPDYQPKQIPPDRFAILNMAFHSEAAGRLSDLLARQAKYATEGKEMPKSIKAQLSKAQDAYSLGAENNQWVDHQSGETNQLRADLKANGFDTQDRLKSPFETLSPQHILETSESPLPKQEGDLPTVRPHGFEADPAQLADKGLPQSKAVASGFLPADEDYRGEHGAPDKDSGAPLNDVSSNGIYPEDFYGPKGLQYYGTGEGKMDSRTMSLIHEFQGKPNARAAIFRAVPYEPTNSEKIEKYEAQKRYIQKNGEVPTDGDSFYPKIYNKDSSSYYEHASNQIDALKSSPKKEQNDYQINPGDWVTINRDYAKNHGQSALGGKFKIIRKSVPAKDIFTNGDSIHEWGYDPASKASFLPNEGTPEEDQTGSPAGQQPSESPQGGLSSPGASKEDTGKPEDGNSPSERLMREAEEAGVSISLETMKGLLRGQTQAMAKVRGMIRDRTGKDARFLPATPYDPDKDKNSGPIIDEGQPAWINRFEQLYQKDAKGGLTPAEDDELDALHQKLNGAYGSLNAYDRERKKQGLPRISMTTQEMAKRRLMAA